MPLPSLNWRMVGPVAVSGSIATLVASYKSLIINSCSMWGLVENAATGSNTLVVHPLLSSTGTQFIITTDITGSSAYNTLATGHGPLSGAWVVGLVPDINESGGGAFITGNHDNPFGTAPRWSGYLNGGILLNQTSTWLMESEEVILFGGSNNISTMTSFGTLAGAIIESTPNATGGVVGGNDGRVYGLATCGNTTSWQGFNTSRTLWLGGTAGGTGHQMVVFSISGTINSGRQMKLVANHAVDSSMQAYYQILFPSGVIGLPYLVTSVSTPHRYVGRLRGIYRTNNSVGFTTWNDSSNNPIAYGLATNRLSTSSDTMMLAPASGTSTNIRPT